MIYRILADIVVVVHLLWIIFLVIGAFWGRKYRPVMLVHGAGLAFSAAIQVFGWYCPLTHLETWLEVQGGLSRAYQGSFIGHYARELVYIEVTPTVIFALTFVLVAANLWIYRKALKRNGSLRR